MNRRCWTTDEQGRIKVNPTTNFDTVAFANGAAGGLRLEYALDHAGQKRAAAQFVMTEKQASDLIEALTQLVQDMRRAASANKPANQRN